MFDNESEMIIFAIKVTFSTKKNEEENEKKSRNHSSNYFDKNVDEFLYSGAFQRMEIQNFSSTMVKLFQQKFR